MSNSSMQSIDTEGSLSNNVLQYGPIQVRSYQKQVPTIATGRRSKHLILDGDEAIKREKKRERNRDAAKKIKEKRQFVEEDLDQQLKQLENEHSNLQDYLTKLQERKQNLEDEMNNLIVNPVEDALLNHHNAMLLPSHPYSIDTDLFDESIQRILNFGSDSSFHS